MDNFLSLFILPFNSDLMYNKLLCGVGFLTFNILMIIKAVPNLLGNDFVQKNSCKNLFLRRSIFLQFEFKYEVYFLFEKLTLTGILKVIVIQNYLLHYRQ